jgi:hypothetical protein
VKPTRISELVAAFVVTAVGVRLLADPLYTSFGDRLKGMPVSAPLTLFLLALFEFYSAHAIRVRLDGRPGSKPILPMTVARYAVLAKASSLGAAVAGGFWAGLFAFTLTHVENFRYAGADRFVSAASVASAVLLVAAALRLERACRVRTPPGPRPDVDEP